MTGPIDLRLGDWRESLADVEADSLITDPPYSARTHAGQRSADNLTGSAINYDSISPEEIAEFVTSWAPRIRRWFVVFGDHITAPVWLQEFERAGLLAFAPVVWVKRSPPPRFSGDGPACGVEWIAIARTRSKFAKPEFGSRPGAYRGPRAVEAVVMGQKPDWLMRALIRDYSLEGELIVDPFSGSGTTLMAARGERRRSVGTEVDEERFLTSQQRIASPWPAFLF
jgi:site-specific DNA-methyltransferase (adenine-specific)